MSDLHKKTIELLPWYVSGSLSSAESAELERHIGECIPCRTALAQEKRLHGLISRQEDVPLSAEHGISDLMTRIDHPVRRRDGRTLRPRFAFGAAIVCAVIVASLLLIRSPGPDIGGGEFSTLTDPAEHLSDRIDIVLSDGVDASEILAVIAQFDGTVIDGPSDLGRYTVGIPGSEGMSMQDVIDTLADDRRVRFVSRNFIAVPDASEDEP